MLDASSIMEKVDLLDSIIIDATRSFHFYTQVNPDFNDEQSACVNRNYFFGDVAGGHELFNCDIRWIELAGLQRTRNALDYACRSE